MVIDVRLVPEGRSCIEKEAELSEYRDDLPPFLSPLSCRAELDRSGGVIAVSLRFDGEFEVECARCLKPVGVAVGGDMRLVLKEAPGRRGPALDDEGAGFFFDTVDNLVDLGPAVYDEIMIALPMMPLCSEGCAGAWVASAAPAADVGEREVDPRWAGLLKLKNN
jgi:uncharacterized metal-binding protein YceD (DUF177 family)